MTKYALFGARVKNGTREVEGGWHDYISTANSIEEIKEKIIEETEEISNLGCSFLPGRMIDVNTKRITYKVFLSGGIAKRIDWYQIVNLETGVIEEEHENSL